MLGADIERLGGGRVRSFGAGLVAASLLTSAAALAESADCPLAPTEAADAAEAIDGDTIALKGGAILRLAGIEAAGSPGFGDRGDEAAARDALAARIAGQTLSIAAVGGGMDRYGRVHAQVFLADGTWLQAELVGLGLARAHPIAGETDCVAALLVAENGARAARAGVWRDERYLPRNADDPSLSARSGLYEIVEGRVLSVGHGSYMVFLDFGRNYRADFTAMVPAPVAERLANAGFEVDSLEGRHVRVRGVIEESGGPAIRIEDPMMLEVLDGG